MQRSFLRPFSCSLVVVAACGLAGVGLVNGPVRAQTAAPVVAPASQASSAMVVARTKEAAERILVALRNGDADSRYRQFAPSLQRVTSPTMIRQRMEMMPKLLRWTLGPVVPGQDSSTITARLVTSAGPRDLLMVIDANGRLEGYHFDAADQPAETVAKQFVELISQGRYISSNSLLSPELQSEIPPAAMQIKWQRLQRLTGDFVAIKQVFRSESSGDQKLVLVKIEFRRITDTLFVILDGRNQIVGVDFPTEPNPPAPSR
jgi:hypothetical protein